ncbi:MAG TPA: hypothetical protein VKE94_18010 [Gemmataceae bacterium]|nr:hypothetical protein [Gemmataceae bacterium]
MATEPVTAKLRLRLELIAALPEPMLLDGLRRLAKAELIVFRRCYAIRECRCKGRCKVEQYGERHARRACVAEGRSRRLSARLREVRDNPTSMYQLPLAASIRTSPRPMRRRLSRTGAYYRLLPAPGSTAN